MLNTYPTSRQSGFTLVEVMVAILILGILAAIAAPNFQTWLKNSQIRNAAESIANGLQRARAEAVARNTNIAFSLTGINGVSGNSSWSVSVVTPASGIDSRTSLEGSKDVTITPVAADLATTATIVTFNNFGSVATNALVGGTTPPTLAQVNVTATGGTRNLRVEIGVGGNAKMCDPSAPAGSSSAC